MPPKYLSLNDELYDYLLDVSLRESDVLRRLREATSQMEESLMQVAPDQGQFMALLVRLMGARRALEVGVFTGYSSLCVAQALPKNGVLTACDISEEWTAIARRYWRGMMERGLDHLVYATPDLHASVEALTQRFGTEPSPGGAHAGWGTRNALIGLGIGVYLEIIGPDHRQPDPERSRPFLIDNLTDARLVTWAYRHPDPESMRKTLELTLRNAPGNQEVRLGPVRAMSRARPDARHVGDRPALDTALRPIRADGVDLASAVSIVTRVRVDEAADGAMFGRHLRFDAAPRSAIAGDDNFAPHIDALSFERLVVGRHALVHVDQLAGDVAVY